jgi:hypothetical protein
MVRGDGVIRARGWSRVVAAGAALGLLAIGGPAAAEGEPEPEPEPEEGPWLDERPDGWDIGDSTPAPGNGSGNGGDTGNGGATGVDDGPAGGAYAIRVHNGGEDGERCWEVIWVPLPGYEPEEDAWDHQAATEAGEETWGERYDQCPGADDPDPTGAVHAVWADAALLPDNDVHIAPGWALTGMPAYLEVRGERTLQQSTELPAPFGDAVTFDASASYEVDWGDGTTTGPHDSSGGPHPEGDIVHTYADATEITVVVTATWTGEWAVGGRNGALPPIERQHELPLEIRELQSVRTGGR